MLTISNKCRYGLAAVLELAEFSGPELLQIKDIAFRCAIPRQYLEQIFNQLGKAGIVQSVRGKNGGFRLARPAAQIPVLEIVTLLEGGIAFAPDQEEQPDAIHALLKKAQQEFIGCLEISLAELAARQQKMRSAIMFHI